MRQRCVTLFRDRNTAGRALAIQLARHANQRNVVVLAIPRGGVPVAYEIARTLHLPLDIIIVRKLLIPGNPKLSLGSIVSGGVRLINHQIVRLLNLTQFGIDSLAAQEQEDIERCEDLYRNGWPALDLHQRTVIIVDDGIATGTTMHAAVLALKQRYPTHIIVTAPTVSQDSYKMLKELVDEVICLSSPLPYISVRRWYEYYNDTGDEEICNLLIQAAKESCIAANQRFMH